MDIKNKKQPATETEDPLTAGRDCVTPDLNLKFDIGRVLKNICPFSIGYLREFINSKRRMTALKYARTHHKK